MSKKSTTGLRHRAQLMGLDWRVDFHVERKSGSSNRPRGEWDYVLKAHCVPTDSEGVTLTRNNDNDATLEINGISLRASSVTVVRALRVHSTQWERDNMEGPLSWRYSYMSATRANGSGYGDSTESQREQIANAIDVWLLNEFTPAKLAVIARKAIRLDIDWRIDRKVEEAKRLMARATELRAEKRAVSSKYLSIQDLVS